MVPVAAKDNHRAEGLLSRVADSIAVEIMADLAMRLERRQRKRSTVQNAIETANADDCAGPEAEATSAIEDFENQPIK